MTKHGSGGAGSKGSGGRSGGTDPGASGNPPQGAAVSREYCFVESCPGFSEDHVIYVQGTTYEDAYEKAVAQAPSTCFITPCN